MRRDKLTPEQRSYCMSRVKSENTELEKLVFTGLRKLGLRFKTHVKDLPGKPDIVFPKTKVVVFIDGDFWHGYRFPLWKDKVTDFWKVKLEKNRERDRRNFRRLRNTGWKTIRIWQHEIEKDIEACISKIESAVCK